MANIEEMEAKMTVYYYKSTGDIYTVCSGIQDMNFFSNHANDMDQIIDFIVTDKNEFVFRDLYQFRVNLNTIIIETKPLN